MNRREVILEDGGNDKYPRAIVVDESQGKCYFWATLVGTVLLGLSAIIALLISLFSNSFDLNLTATTDFRVGTTKDDAFPTAPMLASAGPIDVPILLAFISVFGFVGYLVLVIWWKQEVAQMSTGGSPFLMFAFIISTFSVWLAISLFAGITNTPLLAMIMLASIVWVGFWWVSDLVNSPFYITAGMKAYNTMEMGWGWLWWVMAAIIGLTVTIIEIIYMVHTYGSSPASPSRIFVVYPIIAIILYLPLPVIVMLRYFGWWFASTYKRDIVLIIYWLVYLLIMTWLGLIITTQTP